MKLFCSNIKRIHIFSQKKSFLIFPEMKPCTFKPKLEKKNNSPIESFLYFRKRKPRKKKLFLCFGKRKPVQNYLYLLL